MKISIKKEIIIIILMFLVKLKELFITPLLSLFALCCKNSAVARRIRFERDVEDRWFTSFAVKRECADVLFHISSEGELEQVIPIIEDLLDQGKRIELLYTSPSVDEKCRKLAEKSWPLMRILPLPLLGTLADEDILFWATAQKVVMCRYDFFPELLLLLLKVKQSILVSASVKKYERNVVKWWHWHSFYWKTIFSFFNFIIPASPKDELLIKKLASTKVTAAYDFRVLQIFNRVEKREQVVLPTLGQEFINLICSSNQSLIVGSGWESEIRAVFHPSFIDRIKAKDVLCYFAPHSLHESFLSIFEKLCNDTLPVYVITREMSLTELQGLIKQYSQAPGIFYSQKPGILCELYYYFDVAFIGGGWGRSIHSVLEPFLANCIVTCGPKIFRSTEIDLITAWKVDEVEVLTQESDFSSSWLKLAEKNCDSQLRFHLQQEYQQEYDRLMKVLFHE